MAEWVRLALNRNARWMLIISGDNDFFSYAKSYTTAEYEECLAAIRALGEGVTPDEELIAVVDLSKVMSGGQTMIDTGRLEDQIAMINAARGEIASVVQVGDG